MKKLIYSQPTAEIYELKLRGNVLQGVSPDGPGSANNGYNGQGNDLGDLDD